MRFLYIIKKSIPLLLLIITQTACQKTKSLDSILQETTKNDVYRDIDEATFAEILQQAIKEESKHLSNPKFIFSYYQKNAFQPVLLKKFLPNHQLDSLSYHLKNVTIHGLSPKSFRAERYESLLRDVMDKKAIKTSDEAYRKLARLELFTANNLLNYNNSLSFGFINPRKLFRRYFMETKRPDSLSMSVVLNAKDLTKLLDSIQPASENYKTLQQALRSEITNPDKNKNENSKIIKVNLERLRWQHPYDHQNMVYVNIPAYNLTVIEQGRIIDKMKVAVGTGRNINGKDKISLHTKPVTDTPHSHETPILSSLIHSVQVNPVWNIPKSIATKEILKHVQADRFYLTNNGIDVLQNGNVIEDSESIDWSSISQEDLPYRFRQRPGNENALGKIKFLFKNNSSVYLHDTPSKVAFNKKIRAVSHGCVRVEKPLELAHILFGEGDKFNIIKRDMETKEVTKANDISLDPKTTVVLDYNTIAVTDGQLIFYPDVYGLDIVLYTHLYK